MALTRLTTSMVTNSVISFDGGDKTFIKMLKQVGAVPFFSRDDAMDHINARFN
jgi:hypothetical protein